MQIDTSIPNIEQFSTLPIIEKDLNTAIVDTQDREDVLDNSTTNITLNKIGKVAFVIFGALVGSYLGGQLGHFIEGKLTKSNIVPFLKPTYFPIASNYDGTCSISSEVACLKSVGKSLSFYILPESLVNITGYNQMVDYNKIMKLFKNIQNYCSQVIGLGENWYSDMFQWEDELFKQNPSLRNSEPYLFERYFVRLNSWNNCLKITSKAFYKKIDEFCRNAKNDLFSGASLFAKHVCGCGELEGKRFFDFTRFIQGA